MGTLVPGEPKVLVLICAFELMLNHFALQSVSCLHIQFILDSKLCIHCWPIVTEFRLQKLVFNVRLRWSRVPWIRNENLLTVFVLLLAQRHTLTTAVSKPYSHRQYCEGTANAYCSVSTQKMWQLKYYTILFFSKSYHNWNNRFL